MGKKALLIVLDSLGVGGAQDAAQYGDEGSNTLSNIVAANGGLNLPNLCAMGLPLIEGVEGLEAPKSPIGAYGRLHPLSAGKDTTTGHWELAGLVTETPFPTYPDGFPSDVIEAFQRAVSRGVLGNKPASGTAILDELGVEHLRTGDLIVYTSGDSVFQIAAHEELVPPDLLYDYCLRARDILSGEHAVARVIARPFVGQPGAFTRTGNRKDFSLPPPQPTLLDALSKAGHEVMGVGKIEDIFDMRGLTTSNHAAGNAACLEVTHEYLAACSGGLIFVNLVDFDMLYGHRNDPVGYGAALEAFDLALPRLMRSLNADDLLILTADHGCDPTTPGTDHTREQVPLLIWSPSLMGGIDLGSRTGFNTVAATVAAFFGLSSARFGEGVMGELRRFGIGL